MIVTTRSLAAKSHPEPVLKAFAIMHAQPVQSNMTKEGLKEIVRREKAKVNGRDTVADIIRLFNVHDLTSLQYGPAELALMDSSLNAVYDTLLEQPQTYTVIIQPRSPEVASELPQLRLQVSTKNRAQRAYFIGEARLHLMEYDGVENSTCVVIGENGRKTSTALNEREHGPKTNFRVLRHFRM